MKELENVEKLYKLFIEKTSNKEFIIGFIDYFSYIDKHQVLIKSFSKDLERKKELEEKFAKIQEAAIDEFNETYNKIKKEIAKLGLENDDRFLESYGHIKDIFDGTVSSSLQKPNSVYGDLVDIAQYLMSIGHLDIIRKYAKLYEKHNPILLDYIIAPKYEEMRMVKHSLDKAEETEMWAVISRLNYVHEAFLNADNEYQRIGKNRKATTEQMLNFFYLNDVVYSYNQIIKPKNNDNDFSHNMFAKHSLINDIQRFHTYMVINYEPVIDTLQKASNTVILNKNKNILKIKDIELSILAGSVVQIAIAYMFQRSDFYEECFFDEMREENIFDKSKMIEDKNIRDAFYQFRDRLEKNNIEDFIIVKAHSVIINEKYKKK